MIGKPLSMDALCEPPGCWPPARRPILEFSPDGDVVVSSDPDGGLRLWAVETGTGLGVLGGPGLEVSSVAFAPQVEVLAVGGMDGSIRFLETDKLDGDGGSILTSSGSGVWSLAFSPDGRRVAAGTGDGAVSVWNREESSLIASGAVHSDAVLSIAFSPDGRRLVSSGGDGTLRVWDPEGRGLETETPSCFADAVVWRKKDVIIASCNDRLVVWDSVLQKRGEVLAAREGLVAAVSGLGVYASPTRLKDEVVSFGAAENLGVPEAISQAMMRRQLFENRSAWVELLSAVAVASESTGKWLIRVHRSMGVWATPVWVAMPWVLSVGAAAIMWVLFPARLASWSMPRAGRVPLAESLPLGVVANWVLAFLWIGRTERPLTNWVRKNREVLEAACFTEREPVKEREKYFPAGHGSALQPFQEKIEDLRGRGLLWIQGVGGSGKSALAVHLLREALIGRKGLAIPVFVGEDWKGSLAKQVAKQFRERNWKRAPNEAMVRTLGANGLICPLVDSLSERGGRRLAGSKRRRGPLRVQASDRDVTQRAAQRASVGGNEDTDASGPGAEAHPCVCPALRSAVEC